MNRAPLCEFLKTTIGICLRSFFFTHASFESVLNLEAKSVLGFFCFVFFCYFSLFGLCFQLTIYKRIATFTSHVVELLDKTQTSWTYE